MMEAYPGIEKTEMFAKVKRCLEQRECHQIENEFTFPDGATGWFLLGLSPVPEGVFIMSLDITERKRAEEQLRASEARLNEAQQFAQIGSWELDLRTDVLTWSDEIYRMFGMEPQEFKATYEAFLGAIHPDDREMVNQAYTDSVRNKTPYSIDHRLLMKDGRIKYVHERCKTHYDASGQAPRSIGTVQDITERKRAEEALRRSEERYRILHEYAGEAIFAFDTDLKLIEINRTGCELVGKNREELIGRDVFELEILHPEDMKLAKNAIVRLLGGVNRVVQKMRFRLWDGGYAIFIVTSAPVLKDGNIAAITNICHDVTQEEKLLESLRSAVAEREVMLREIHHRVKNNIQIISSLLRLQSQPIKDEKTLEIFRESQTRIRSMALIHEKLYQSRDFSRIDFSDYIEKMVIHLYALYEIEPERIRLRVEAKDVQLDINRTIPFGLIINELVTNVLKHAFPGDRQGELAIMMQTDEGGRYRLTIKDTGIGIPEGFDLSKSRTLGFQIVRDLVKQIDGTIEFKRDGGTEFVITC